MESILFYILAATAVIAALATITRRRAFISAVWLVVSLVSIAGIFALLAAPFLAVIQILIAAGAVMVLFIFVIMLVSPASDDARPRIINFGKILGMIAAAYLAIVLILATVRPPFTRAPLSGDAYEAPLTLGRMVFGRYIVPFELAGILLLVAAVAAVVLAKKEKC